MRLFFLLCGSVTATSHTKPATRTGTTWLRDSANGGINLSLGEVCSPSGKNRTSSWMHQCMNTWLGCQHPFILIIPFHIAEAVKCAGRLRVECSIQSQAVSDRTRPGSDSSSPRYASTASILSSMLPYVLPSTHLRTSWKTRSAGFNSGLYGGWMMVASPTLRTISPR